MPQIFSEAVFNKHAAAHGLPLLGDEQTRDGYIDEHATTDETARCFKEAFAASDVADHVETAHWLNQARQSYVPPARTKTRA
jgi:hypothetical protein